MTRVGGRFTQKMVLVVDPKTAEGQKMFVVTRVNE